MRNVNIFTLLMLITLLSSCNLFKKSNTSAVEPVQYSAKSGNAQLDYIQNYRNAAIIEMDRGGVPASIILAQGILESNSGQSELAIHANNHFGIKCSSGWKGKTYHKKDDDRDKNGDLIESCFRRYDNVSESFYDHGEFLRDPRKSNRYGFLFNLDRTDYKGWARGLQSAGYATSSDYADKLINLIERYELFNFDRSNSSVILNRPNPGPARPNSPNPPNNNSPNNSSNLPPLQRIGRVNDVKVVLSQNGETLDDIARLYRISTDKVVAYNDRGYPPGVRLRENTRIFIQKKKSKWHGRATEHFVQDGQTMFDVSQMYGMCLDRLRSRNNMVPGQEPAIGERLKLKGKRGKSDMVRLRDTSKDPEKKQDGNWPSTPSPKPSTTTPDAKEKMTTDNDELFEIEGGGADKKTTDPKPQPVVVNRPSTSDNAPKPNPNAKPQPVKPNPAPVTPPPSGQIPSGYHMVEKGETLFALQRKYGTPVAKIKSLNNLKSNDIKAGQILRVKE